MDDAVRAWIGKILVLDIHSLRDLISPESNPLYGQDEDQSPRSFSKQNIGAIISIEDIVPASAANASPQYRNWRLSFVDPAKIENIKVHYTRTFLSDAEVTNPLVDLLLSSSDDKFNERVSALSSTLEFARDFLASPESDSKKLIIHCTHGRHRSPVLALAVFLHHFPQASEDIALSALFKICSSMPRICANTPRLRTGEIAFIDAFMGRGGKLIRAWTARADKSVFNPDNSLRLHERFCRLIDAKLPQAATAFENDRFDLK